MSEEDFLSDDFEAPKQKRGLPKWLLGCGCGCTIMIIAACVLMIVAFKKMTDPEAQWPALRESLYFEERPTELELAMGMSIPFSGQKQYTLIHKDKDFTANFYVFGGEAELEALFMTEGKGLEKMAIPDNAVLGETLVQGRTVRSMTDTGLSMLPEGLVGPGIRIDISDEDRFRVIEMRVLEGRKPLSSEQIEGFFSMFDVWHE